jgi:hypothetical protein
MSIKQGSACSCPHLPVSCHYGEPLEGEEVEGVQPSGAAGPLINCAGWAFALATLTWVATLPASRSPSLSNFCLSRVFAMAGCSCQAGPSDVSLQLLLFGAVSSFS